MSQADGPQYRYERKLVCENVKLSEALLWIRLNPAMFRTVFPPRHINNIYLDSPGLGHYFENKAGAANRTKVRIRWYGPLLGRVTSPILEFKRKHGLLGTKDSFPLPPFSLENGLVFRALMAFFKKSNLHPQAAAALAAEEPSLVNRYHRHYYLSADGAFRLTLDSGLEYHPVSLTDGSWQCSGIKSSILVVELKYDRKAAPMADRIANSFPTRLTRMSKYCSGIEAIHG